MSDDKTEQTIGPPPAGAWPKPRPLIEDARFEAAARAVLGLVAHQCPDGIWWGDDTNCGTGAEVVGEAVKILKDHLGGR